ncbi:MAG: DUF1513 domain-containing protein [Myxococcota bacterium]
MAVVPRRRFVAGVGAIAVAPVACGGDLDGGPAGVVERWLSAQGDDEQTYGLVVASADEATIITSGFRGHGVAPNPADPNRAVMFSRRPGQYGIVVDLSRGEVLHRFDTSAQRRFAGHGCFTPDAALLLTAEADAQTAEGTIGVRDAETGQLLREIPTHGVGPHELAMMPDGQTVVVANGGILTRPETGADKLNLDTMDSTLAYVDVETGSLVAQARVPEPKASLRHLGIAEDGTVAVAMQIQREALEDGEPRSLIAVHKPGEALEVLLDGIELGLAMKDYAGAIAVDDRSRLAAVTSPRGSLVAFWHLDSGRLKGQVAFDDVSGVAVSKQQPHFVLSGSGGQVRSVDTDTLQDVRDARARFSNVLWDNHMIAVLS